MSLFEACCCPPPPPLSRSHQVIPRRNAVTRVRAADRGFGLDTAIFRALLSLTYFIVICYPSRQLRMNGCSKLYGEFSGDTLSYVDPLASHSQRGPGEVRAAAQGGVQRAVAAGGGSSRSGRRWALPLVAATAVAAAACAPVAWPLLAIGAPAAPAALAAAFGQVGGLGGGLLAEAVIRAWDRLRSRREAGIGQDELQEALADELKVALTSSSARAAALRAEVAGVLQGVDAVRVALATTIEASARDSLRLRAVLVRGLQDLGAQFTEFGWVLEEVNEQITSITLMQAEIAAGSRAIQQAQQLTLVQLAILREQGRRFGSASNGPGGISGPAGELLEPQGADSLPAGVLNADDSCPYPGLAAFMPQDAGWFFGRQQLTASLITRLTEQITRPGFLMVLGPSGSGKSSLLQAGMLPAIAAGGLPLKGSQAWPMDLMTPQQKPLLELATRIAVVSGVPAGALNEDLHADPNRTGPAIRQAVLAHAQRRARALLQSANVTQADVNLSAAGAAAHASPGDELPPPRLILIVDQFEEVFTQCTDEDERRLFIRALCAAAGIDDGAPDFHGDPASLRNSHRSRDAPALVVIGMRADFYGRAATWPELAPWLQDSQVLLGPMNEAELRSAIEEPAASAGLIVDAGLVEVLLADLGVHPRRGSQHAGQQAGSLPGPASQAPAAETYEAGRLPLLAYALQRTWQQREGHRLTVAGYGTTGGIDGAVAQAADAVYAALSAEGQDAARRLLLRMVSLGEGAADTRRRVAMSELAGPAGMPEAVIAESVLTDLIGARLVTATTDTGRNDTVEISHEALLGAWPRLREWLRQDRAGQRTHRELTDAARAWQVHDREPGHLFSGARLAVAREWADAHGRDLNGDEIAFLSASRQHQRRATRLRRGAVAALAVLTLVSAIAAGLAINANHQAVQDRNRAIASQVAAESEQLQASNPSLAAQLDLIAQRLDPTSGNAARLVDAASTALSEPLTGQAGPVRSIAFSPGGRVLAMGGTDNAIRLWNVTDPGRAGQTGRPVTITTTAPVESVAFSPGGRILAAGSGSDTGTIQLWNVTDPAHPARVGQPLAELTAGISLAFSPDGRILAAGSSSGTIRLWNISNPGHVTQIGRPLATGMNVDSLAFSPRGRTLAIGGTGHVQLWNLTHPSRPAQIGKPLALPDEALGPGSPSAQSVAFSRDGRNLAAGSDVSGLVWIWDFVGSYARPDPPEQLATTSEDGISVAFSPVGHMLATAGADGAIWLWNISDLSRPAQIGQPLTGATDGISSLEFSPDGRTLAAGSGDGEVRLWDLPTAVLTGPGWDILSAAFSPKDPILATSVRDGSVWLWNVADPSHPRQIGHPFTASPDSAAFTVVFSPGGRTLIVNTEDGIRPWNVDGKARPTGRTIHVPDGSSSVALSPSGRVLAAGTIGAVELWNITDAARPALIGQPLTGLPGDIDTLAFGAGGNILAAASDSDSDNRIWLWNVSDPAHPVRIGRPLTGPAGPVESIAFSSDGHTLAVGSDDDTVRLWRMTDPAHPSRIGQPLTGPASSVLSVTFSPDGRTLAAGSADGRVWLWNVADLGSIVQVGQPFIAGTGVQAVRFSPSGKTLAAGSSGTLSLWNLGVSPAITRICATTSGNLTPEQWDRNVAQLPYNPPCRHPRGGQ
jgi:WD40 repeat protein